MEASVNRPTKIEIDLVQLEKNIKELKKELKEGQKFCAVVKADAYGHGAGKVAQTALKAGADVLAVATVDEGIELRQKVKEAKDIEILVLGQALPSQIPLYSKYNLTATISDIDSFKDVNINIDKPFTFHLALDTGMGRLGIRNKKDLQEFIEEIPNYTWAKWDGVFTHFSTAGGGPKDYIDTQWNKWLEFLELVPSYVTKRHYANSAMGYYYKDRTPSSTWVRYGIAMYGYDPLDEKSYLSDAVKPCLSLTTEIVYVKQVEKGSKLSYGATYTAEDCEWIATLPIGYADGWLRDYENVPVYVDGSPCPVTGRINMDQMLIKLPKKYPIGTKVTLIGNVQTATDIAREVDTISYEVLCNLSNRVPRYYIEGE